MEGPKGSVLSSLPLEWPQETGCILVVQKAGKPASMDHSLITQALDTRTPELGKGWMLGTSSGGKWRHRQHRSKFSKVTQLLMMGSRSEACTSSSQEAASMLFSAG